MRNIQFYGCRTGVDDIKVGMDRLITRHSIITLNDSILIIVLKTSLNLHLGGSLR